MKTVIRAYKLAGLLLLATIFTSHAQVYTINQGGVKNTCSGTFYDSGGPTANFGTNEKYVITFCPTTATCISLNFTAFDLGSFNTMSIYNGSDTLAPLLDVFTGTNSPGTIGATTAGNGCVTIKFVSGSAGFFTGTGWSANISCVTCTAGPPPSVQDCAGAIPICQNIYSTTTTYVGTGNIKNEIDTAKSCLDNGEKNDVWYTFTVAQSGNLSFNITPNDLSADYDWAVYNLTNKNCADIYNDKTLEVSCNWSQTPGVTGANGNSTLNSQGMTGTPDNAVIPVVAGQTYMVNISNFEDSNQSGYTFDLSPSTAVIFDNIPPVLQTVAPVQCHDTLINIGFSENILCSTVQAADFTVSGPGGTYTVTSASSQICASGGKHDKTFQLKVNPPLSTTGTYKVCLVGGSGSVTDLCSNVANVTNGPMCLDVDVTCIGSAGVTAVGAVVCSGMPAVVKVTNSSGVAPYTYTWNPNIGTGPGPFTVNPTTTTIYTVTITDANGVTASDTAKVEVNITPVAVASNDTTICTGGQVTLTASGASNYQWLGGPATANYTVSPTANTTYTLFAYNGACLDTETVVITVVQGPQVNINPGQISCFGFADGTATAVVTGGTPPYNYIWSTTPAQTTATATGLAAGTYMLIVSDQKCAIQKNVTLTEPPKLSLSVWGDSIICEGNKAKIQAAAQGGTKPLVLSWTNSLPNGTTQVVSPAQTTTYIVTVTDSNKCVLSKPFTVQVQLQPVIAFTKADSGCVPVTAIFTNLSQNASMYTWRFGDGSVSDLISPIHTYSLPGWYDVTLVAKNNLCIDSITQKRYIHVFPYAHAKIITDQSVVSELNPEVLVSNFSTGYNTCELLWGDGTTQVIYANATHIYAQPGTYYLTLMANNKYACNDTTQTTVVVEPETTFYIPQAFSPNDDGRNDLFTAFGTNIHSFEIHIFDRWGNKVYSGYDIQKGWDGTYKGKKAMEDIYVYKLIYTDYKDRKHSVSGRFTLLH